MRGLLMADTSKTRCPKRYPLRVLCGIALTALAAAPAVHGADSGADKPGSPEQGSSSQLMDGWHLVRTPNPRGGPDAISIMHTADTSRSDLDFAGLMIRCQEGAAQALVVLLRPFALRARPHIVFGETENEAPLAATVAAPGTAILIPEDATSLVNGPWQTMNELRVRVDDGQATIRGVVALAGLQPAFKALQASCLAQ